MDYTGQIRKYLDEEIRILQSLDVASIDAVMNVLENARLSGKRIYICGNGGSAATASHYCADFNKGVSENIEQKYDFICLCDNVPTMMAVANDFSYDEIFRYQLKGRIKPEDVFIGISGSGNSANVVNAMEYAKSAGAVTVAIVGYSGGRLKQLADHSIHVNIDNMQISEDVHMICDHVMMYVLNQRF